MIEIKDLLTRFNNILFNEESKKESTRAAISEVIGVQIKSENIKIKNNVIYLNIRPIYKNEILIKQEKIFLKLKESLGKKMPTAVR